MSDISKASAEAVEAARQGEQFAMILAAIQAAQTIQPQQPAAPARPCRSSPARARPASGWPSVSVARCSWSRWRSPLSRWPSLAACIALVALVVYGIYRDIRKR